MPTPKNIAVFCDGTWQQLDQAQPTNVSRLACAVAPLDDQGTPQVVWYDSGVGVVGGDDLAAQTIALEGGAFGIGLDQKISDAYQFLCLNYEVGDRIFIFGFSRGAYTARSLAGLLNRVWICKRNRVAAGLVQALAIYRDPRLNPQKIDPSFENWVENAWDPYYSHPRSDAFLQYIGVWDTVGELGIPKNLLFSKQIDSKYQFYDTDLSPITRSARHAVSIDENRNAYTPTLWKNIDQLNSRSADKAYGERPYQQCWFPGYHSGVGGGQDDSGLSNSALKWIAEGAQKSGLCFDGSQLGSWKENPTAAFVIDPGNPQTDIINAVSGGLGARLPGPTSMDEVSQAAKERCLARQDYRPLTLGAVLHAIKHSSRRPSTSNT